MHLAGSSRLLLLQVEVPALGQHLGYQTDKLALFHPKGARVDPVHVPVVDEGSLVDALLLHLGKKLGADLTVWVGWGVGDGGWGLASGEGVRDVEK